MPDREKILHELDHQVADADWCDNDWKDNVPIWMLRGALALLREYNDCENCAIAIEDRQPVVRCKDCKYWHPLFKPDGYCDCDDMWRSLEGETTEVEYIRTNEDFYCGYAESGR